MEIYLEVEVGGELHVPAALSRYILAKKLDHRAVLDAVEKRRLSFPCKPRFVHRRTSSPLLYRLS
jgi:hypothetical protein